VHEVETALTRLGFEIIPLDDPYAPFSAAGASIVVSVGGDGTLLSASHHISGIPILGINSAPSSSVGFFCGVHPGDVEASLAKFLSGEISSVTLSRMEVLRNGESLARRVLNDALFCHPVPAATSRYLLEVNGVLEEQTSSGLWIGPAAGSTAAQSSAGGEVMPLESRQIQVVVREPYTPHGTPLNLRLSRIEPGHSAKVRCKMREAKIYLDGPHQVIDAALGDLLEFRESSEPLVILGITHERRLT
jgi:NAD+ kinase